MNRRAGILALTAALATGVPGGAMATCGMGSPVQPDTLSPALWALIEDAAYVSRADMEGAAGTMSFTALDLNGDGADEYCAALETTMTCSLGKAVCLHLILRQTPDPAVLFEDTSHELNLGDGAQGGWHNLASVTNTADGPETTPVLFDGAAYQWVE